MLPHSLILFMNYTAREASWCWDFITVLMDKISALLALTCGGKGCNQVHCCLLNESNSLNSCHVNLRGFFTVYISYFHMTSKLFIKADLNANIICSNTVDQVLDISG